MIPRKLHQVWVGPRPVPAEWLGPWRELHPTWDVRLWREADIEAVPMLNRAAYDYYRGKENWVGMSDIARMAILREFGGVYVDIDSRPLRSFEGAPFMASRFFAGYEPVDSLPGRVAAGTIGSEPGHPIFDTLAHLISEMPCIDEVWDTTGGTGLTAAILAHRQCCKPLVLPPRVFYATDARGRPTPGSEGAYCEHFWATTNHAYPMRVVILVPRRADGGRRDRLWRFTRKHWERLGWPIFEGHHDGGRFNASAARNEAARLAGEWDVAVFVDADTIMLDHEPVRRAVKVAAQSGQFVRPYTRYWMTDESGAEVLMAGSRLSSGMRPLRSTDAHGGVNIVPRRLWDALGGYDERFCGWGSEDAAFEIAGRMLGGFEQLPGEVFHLWHPLSADRSTGDPGFQANVALRLRYEAAKRPGMMRALLAERNGGPPAPPEVGVCITTNGRRDCIARTIASLEANVGPFVDRVICDDSGDRAYAAWLKTTFPEWRIAAHPRVGHGPAIKFAMEEAAKLDAEWVFWCEDDFEFPRRVDLGAISRVMDCEGDDLKQMVIRRQAVFPLEIEHGGMIERFDPSLFVEHESAEGPWIEHRQFFSLNPHLTRRGLVAAIARKWPPVPNSEHHFGRKLFANPLPRCGIWGAKSDEPWALHIGESRTGTGY